VAFILAKRVPFFKKEGEVTVAATAADSHGASLESTSRVSIPQVVESVKKEKGVIRGKDTLN